MPISSVKTVGLSRAYDDDYALVDLTTEFVTGTVTAVLGPNGAGKSTLMSCLSTLARPTEGTVLFDGRAVTAQDADARMHIGYVGHQIMLYGALTARENLVFFGRMYGLDDLDARVTTWLDAVELTRDADRPVEDFSRGMAQRLSIARALISEPSLLLLDEPFTGLDQRGLQCAQSLFDQRRDQGAIIVLVSHDLKMTAQLADRVLILRRGRTIFDGPADSDIAHQYHEALHSGGQR
ncbi:MAG: ABC transporter ATP-binding protein [Myxococcota bacterium]|nr:ABC transporter ATP-binding protein [Myxococcota bacterium]